MVRFWNVSTNYVEHSIGFNAYVRRDAIAPVGNVQVDPPPYASLHA